MLIHLAVNNYAIVDTLELELGGGMSVITGETGAGKSIMLDALALTLGDRADSGAVRPGADKADILATFDIRDIPEARQWLDERDLTQDDDQVILRRVITAEGRSRGYINGAPCPQQDLRALGEMLIDIHSQHEHQSLLKTDTHRRLLDEYAGAGEKVDVFFALIVCLTSILGFIKNNRIDTTICTDIGLTLFKYTHLLPPGL